MRVLITAGPTREPIDPVRYIGNRSSGQIGAALASAALAAGHAVTLILGPVTAAMPAVQKTVRVETAAEMMKAVLEEFAGSDLLIMAAAVADYRPKQIIGEKIARSGGLTIECEPTEDILAAAGKIKQSHQRTIGFSLEVRGNLSRSREKLVLKSLDLIIYNPTNTMNSQAIESVLLWPDGRSEALSNRPKLDFANTLLSRAEELFGSSKK